MIRNLTIPIFVFLLASLIISNIAAGNSKNTQLVTDGFVLKGADGKLTRPDSNNGWLFTFDSDVIVGKARISAGTSLELLPSAALEKTLELTKNRETSCRLWGRITKYKGKNFIFGIYFLPFSEIKTQQPQKTQESQQAEFQIAINEPNDALAIPEEIIDRLTQRRIIRPAELRKGVELKADSILVDRTGFIVKQVGDRSIFVLDGLGRNIQQQIELQLLPSQMLEKAERKQAATAEKLRFKIAGIVTQYKTKHYLLLQRAIRAYNYGNFNR